MMKLNKKHKKLIGIIYLIVVSLIAVLFFAFGLMLVLLSVKNLISSRTGFSLVQTIYLIIGIYFVYHSVKNYTKFYKDTIKNPFVTLNKFYKANKVEIIITSIISVILLFIFLNGLYIRYNFILKMILFLPIFILQIMVFSVKIYSRNTLMPIFPSSIFDSIFLIAEIYYVFVVVKFAMKFFNKKKN